MIEFNEEKHEYTLNGKKLISVTQLMKKHGLATNYDNVPVEVLKNKAQRGSLVHKEIEEYLKDKKFGFTDELYEFIEYLKNNKNINALRSEFIVHNDIVAGTVDLLIQEGESLVIADIKTTTKLHKEAIRWQLSIYAYLSDLDIKRGRALHFNDGLKVVEFELLPMEEVANLMECERCNQLYKKELDLSNNELEELYKVEQVIKYYEEKKEEAEKQAKEMRQSLMKAMEKANISNFENDHIKITYVAPTVRKSIDSTRLKKEQPSIYDEYQKESNVKASLRITIKE